MNIVKCFGKIEYRSIGLNSTIEVFHQVIDGQKKFGFARVSGSVAVVSHVSISCFSMWFRRCLPILCSYNLHDIGVDDIDLKLWGACIAFFKYQLDDNFPLIFRQRACL